MRSPPPNANGACQGAAALKNTSPGTNKTKSDSLQHRRSAALEIFTAIDKGNSAQLRVGLSSWRGQHKVELREATSVVAGIYFPTAAGVMLDLELLPQLLEALHTIESQAVGRGLLTRRRTAA